MSSKTLRAIGLILLSGACLAESSKSRFEQAHELGLQGNPRGVRLTISTVNGVTEFQSSQAFQLQLAFTARDSRVYTAELAPGGSAAAQSDELVLLSPASNSIRTVSLSGAIVCCGSKRRYLGTTAITALSVPFKLALSRPLNPLRDAAGSRLPTGEYEVFIRTRRVMRGLPPTAQAAYHDLPPLVTTSSNVLKIRIADGDQGK